MPTYEQPEWPGMERYSDTPMFNTKAVVQQTGVPAPTLRAWERRYALLIPGRAENAYRLYSERDIALVRWLKERVDKGMSISQAVALFRHLDEEQRNAHKQVPASEQRDVSLDRAPEEPAAFHFAVASSELPVEAMEQMEQGNGNLKQLPHPSQLQHVNADLYNLQMARERLLVAFQNLDEQSANVTMGMMLSVYSIEEICLELITPTLWEVGRLWAEAKLTVSVEHFASHFFRAVLTNVFHMMPEAPQGPLVITCCAPGEPHELPALMLSLFLRRRGLRVVYLGQSIETVGLMHTLKKLAPALVCVSVTIPTYIPALANLGSQIEGMSMPRPLFVFGGQAFTLRPEAASSVPGVYLKNGDLRAIAQRILDLLAHGPAPQNDV